jgi:hypothetical protein
MCSFSRPFAFSMGANFCPEFRKVEGEIPRRYLGDVDVARTSDVDDRFAATQDDLFKHYPSPFHR